MVAIFVVKRNAPVYDPPIKKAQYKCIDIIQIIQREKKKKKKKERKKERKKPDEKMECWARKVIR